MTAQLNPCSSVLIVDDEPGNRETLRGVLMKEGYHLVFATSGAEALEQAATLVPDLILLDVMMPDMNGYEVCRRLRADALLADVPVIMLTALDDRESLLEGIEAGADDFISKPYDRTELRARVRTITRLNRSRRLLLERTKFAWVVEQSADGYLIIDDHDKIQYMNQQARVYLARPHDMDAGVSHPFLELASQYYRCEPQTAWLQWPAPLLVPAPRYLVRAESATARALWLHVDTLRLPTPSQHCLLVHLRDITAQKTLQHDIWKFQTAISHKLRTPIGGILGSLQVLEMEVADSAPQCTAMAEMVELAMISANRLRGEIDDILHYLNTPSLVRPGEGCDLTALRELAHAVGTALEIKSMTFACHAQVQARRLALTPATLELVLQEIIENAKKFHPNHAPTINVIVTPADAGTIRLQLCDDGVRLSPEQTVRAWEPYYQGEKQLTGEVTGMGLGLATVATLIWEAGGSYRLYNQENGPGIVVELLLPVLESER